MSFRGIWIIAKDNKEEGHLLFSRKYTTVERRHKLIHGGTPEGGLPEDSKFVKSLFSKLEIGRTTDEFVEEYDGCRASKGEPVFALNVNGEEIWPVVVIQKVNLVLACLALLENKRFDCKTTVVEIPAISIGYALLHNIVEFLEISAANNVQVSSQFEELDQILKILMPFGTPTDTNLNTVKNFMTGKDIGWIPKYKLSAWRPVLHKGKNQLQVNIEEKVNAVIYNHVENTVYRDTCQSYGTVSCKAEIEGVPEISLNLVSKPNVRMVFHPCLQSNDMETGRSSSLGNSPPEFYKSVEQGPVSRTVRFTPPLDQFPLCHFSCDSQLPVTGVYYMRANRPQPDSTQVLLKLQLSEGIKNSFEYFEVHIPFFYRGPIIKMDFVTDSGALLVSPEKRRLVWSVGQKFPKSLRTSLGTTVTFADPTPGERTHFEEDPFCKGQSSYVQLYFKLTNSSLSGSDVDHKSVYINPRSNTKINIAKELVASDYKIWNVHGDAIVAFPPTI